MVGQGAGSSRRSHTKSRKGCRTCKRRHIRCDETFPQCRNCTKHQVRCDYMESVGSDSDSAQSPEQTAVVLTPDSEYRVDRWLQTGSFPHPDLQVFPQPSTNEYSRNELRLIHHLSDVSNDLMQRGTTNLTIWTQKMPKFLSIAASYPYVMHALLSFSANHLAWAGAPSEPKNLHIHHGGIALGGLHEAIGNFSHANADAVLAASLLMLWQATDWRSWSSLRSGIQSVLTTMHSWKHESLFAEFVVEEDPVADAYRSHSRKPSISPADRSAVLQTAIHALQSLQMLLVSHDVETHWTAQLTSYLQRLEVSEPARDPEDQFKQLYHLRKWLFWVPPLLLHKRVARAATMATLAHFYATSLALEPLFPDLGSSFCGAMTLPPLEAIIRIMDPIQPANAMNAETIEFASQMQWPQTTAMSFRARAIRTQPPSILSSQQDPLVNFDQELLNVTSVGNLSPSFAPSPLHYGSTPQSTTSTQSSSFLEVPPYMYKGFGSGTQSWGTVPSPGLPPVPHVTPDQQQQMFGMYMQPLSSGSFGGGFVPPAPIWT